MKQSIDIDHMTDVRNAPVWVRFFLLMKKGHLYDVPGWQYQVAYKTVFGKLYFVRAYIKPRNELFKEILSGSFHPGQTQEKNPDQRQENNPDRNQEEK